VGDDFDLLDAWRAGDARAGNELFQRHFDAVLRFFANKVPDEVDELVQRTFLAVVEGKDRVRGEGGIRPYIFGVARNVLRRWFREKKTRGQRFDALEHSVHDSVQSPTSLMAEREEQRLLLEALRRIPLDMQIALELYYWEDLPAPALAAVLEIPEGTVRSRLRRGKELLEAALAQLAASPNLLESTLANLDSWARALKERASSRDQE
jgi:RNA polymerase sigma factor (sigma-70 family)